MKKILMLVAVALILITSCKQEKIIEDGFYLALVFPTEWEWEGEPLQAFGNATEEREFHIYAYKDVYNSFFYDLSENDWSVSCDVDWCHYKFGSNMFLASIVFSLDDNDTGENRTATFTISAKGQSITVEVEQLGIPLVMVSTPGTLTQELADNGLLYATSLKISGVLNDKDLEAIKSLRETEVLDLYEAIIEDLPDEIFYENEAIKRIKLPKTIQVIHPKVFAYSSLEYIYIPKNIQKIEDGVFNPYYDYATGAFSEAPLREIEFESDSKLEYIGDGAFTGCGIRSSYQTVGGDTRYYSELNITMPASVEHIGSYVFGDTPNFFADVNLEFENNSRLRYFGKSSSSETDSNASKYAAYCSWDLTLDLRNCKNVEYIGLIKVPTLQAFTNLMDAYIGNSVPPKFEGLDKYSDDYAYLYVPSGCVGVYYEADGWKEFDKIEEIEQ